MFLDPVRRSSRPGISLSTSYHGLAARHSLLLPCTVPHTWFRMRMHLGNVDDP